MAGRRRFRMTEKVGFPGFWSGAALQGRRGGADTLRMPDERADSHFRGGRVTHNGVNNRRHCPTNESRGIHDHTPPS